MGGFSAAAAWHVRATAAKTSERATAFVDE